MHDRFRCRSGTRRALVVLSAVGALAAACTSSGEGSDADRRGVPPTTATTAAPTGATATAGPAGAGVPPTTATLVAAGDIAGCSSRGDEATAALLDARPDATVATLGDLAYDSGTAKEFADCYGPTWGRHRARTRPAPGNHEYETDGASGYFGYFGPAAGDPSKGYYSYDLGSWHVVVVNSNCGEVGCEADSAQEAWVRADLAAHPAVCTLAYWHHPRFSSGSRHGSQSSMAAIWSALYDLGADLVLAGHDHDYERLGPLDPTGAVDETRGIRSFVVGTGGRSHSGFGRPRPGSEVRNDDTFGVLALTLRPTGYDWQFVPEAGRTFTDAGSAGCH